MFLEKFDNNANNHIFFYIAKDFEQYRPNFFSGTPYLTLTLTLT